MTDIAPESPRVEVHDDPAALATAVAGELVSRLLDAQQAGREPHVALTGGTIADAIHREVARQAADSGVDWTRVVWWFGDERFVAADSPDRNARQAREAFLDAVGAPAEQVHEVPAVGEADSVDHAATAYAEDLRASGAGEFDLVMLGVGPDGHVASLFPGYPQLSADGIAVGVTDSPKPPPERVSLTFACLSRSRAVWFLVSGDGKAEAVARALDPAPASADPVAETPARGVRGRIETTWFLDRDAASRL